MARAITRRCPVIFRPLSIHLASMLETVSDKKFPFGKNISYIKEIYTEIAIRQALPPNAYKKAFHKNDKYIISLLRLMVVYAQKRTGIYSY